DNFRPGRPEDSNHVRRIRVQMTGQASYECLCRFLDGLHGLPRLTQVSRMMIEPATAAGTYPIEMEISIFFAADNAKEEHAKVAQR
ncbi:MAG: hypothetical protein KDA89_23460, partial [Planctomycetaceae bacterium]|nr:hypothetical protein [Planctomycetaceae bacterium]